LQHLCKLLSILIIQKVIAQVHLNHIEQVDTFDCASEECRPLVLNSELSEIVALLQILFGFFTDLVVSFYFLLDVLDYFFVLDLVSIVYKQSFHTSVDL